MNASTVGIRSQSSPAAYGVARSVSGGGTAIIAGGNDARAVAWVGGFLKGSLNTRSWRLLSTLNVRNVYGLPVPFPQEPAPNMSALVAGSEVYHT